jgi:hypothetical protein
VSEQRTIETEVALRSLVEEETAAIAEGATSRWTNGELALLRSAADELEQAKQTAEELLSKLIAIGKLLHGLDI